MGPIFKVKYQTMSKITTDISLAWLHIDKEARAPLHIQLYDAIREAILKGKLRQGQKLPASRTLAAELQISRNTVTLAFEQLMIEGYIQGKTGSGHICG